MRIIIASALLFLSPALSAGTTPTVPDQFVGSWAGSPESCGSDIDDLALRINRHSISYWESTGPIKSVVVRGSREIALIAELSGEGDTWLATAKFTLSADGDQLIDDSTIPGKTVVRHRCPSGTAAQPNSSFKPNPYRATAYVLLRYASTQSPSRYGSA